MAEAQGWIALYRKFEGWEWYKDPITKAVFIDLLITANWKDGAYKGHPIKRGQTVIGRKAMADKLGISEQQVRTALLHLEKSGEISRNSTNKFTIVTLCKYNDYQSLDMSIQPTTNQQLTNNQPHHNKVISNKYVYKDIYISKLVDYLNEKSGKRYRMTRATEANVKALIDAGYTEADIKAVIDWKVTDWMGTKYEPGLAPKSLFEPSRFDGYINEKPQADNTKELMRELMALQIKWNEEGLDSAEEKRMKELEVYLGH